MPSDPVLKAVAVDLLEKHGDVIVVMMVVVVVGGVCGGGDCGDDAGGVGGNNGVNCGCGVSFTVVG